jgi:hypothetical protein
MRGIMKTHINRRRFRRYLDRRSANDRRLVYSLNYFLLGGTERRGIFDRRQAVDRRRQDAVPPIRRWPTLS